jgi:hypothetical protein
MTCFVVSFADVDLLGMDESVVSFINAPGKDERERGESRVLGDWPREGFK